MIYYNKDEYFATLYEHGANPKILCEGDSWFAIPDIANIPLQLDTLLDLSILNIAQAGDTLHEMSEGAQFALLCHLMHDSIYGQRWDALLLSAGGNDIVGDGMQYFLQNTNSTSSQPEDYVNQEVLNERLQLMQSRLERIIQTRDDSIVNPNTPIIIHTYAYLTPRNAAYKILAWNVSGPWVYPYMLHKGITDCALQKEIVVYLLNRFYDLLSSVAARPNSNFHVIDSRLALPRVECAQRSQQSKWWADEIHPTSKGFRLIAKDFFVPQLRALGVV